MSGPEPTPGGVPSEEELRAAYEAELARITAMDMIAQAAVSLLNIGARRMGPPPAPSGAEQPAAAGGPQHPERDLEQVRDAIDAARALLGIMERGVPAEQLRPLRDALSQLQMAYAAEVGGPGDGGGGGPEGGGPGGGPGDGDSSGGGPGDGGGGPGGPAGPEPGPGAGGQEQDRGPGPAESSGRLWVPGR